MERAEIANVLDPHVGGLRNQTLEEMTAEERAELAASLRPQVWVFHIFHIEQVAASQIRDCHSRDKSNLQASYSQSQLAACLNQRNGQHNQKVVYSGAMQNEHKHLRHLCSTQ